MTAITVHKRIGSAALSCLFALMLAVVVAMAAAGVNPALAQSASSVRPPPDAVTAAPPAAPGAPGAAGLPTHAAPGFYPSADMWRSVREGLSGRVSIPDKNAGTLIQSEGENFRIVQNGPLPEWGGWTMLGMVVLLALFFAIRGRIRVDGGFSGRSILRFDLFERFNHWLTAVSFIVLGLTGLDILYGRYVLIPVIGPWAFAELTMWSKYAHNYIAFAFMTGLVLLFVTWVAQNLPTLVDLKWLASGGGLLVKGKHAPAYKFNAGQKLIFWFVVIAGISVSFSGICLLFPFQIHPFGPTFEAVNLVATPLGYTLPTDLTALQETQLALMWHAIVALVFIALIFAHIYIGTLGMEGAFSAMSTGMVDENWAHQHHSLWYEEVKQAEKAGPQDAAAIPAE